MEIRINNVNWLKSSYDISVLFVAMELRKIKINLQSVKIYCCYRLQKLLQVRTEDFKQEF